jgi:hypothetical protein
MARFFPETFQDKSRPATDQSLDLSIALRAFLNRFVRDCLSALKPEAAFIALIFIGRHDLFPSRITQSRNFFIRL